MRTLSVYLVWNPEKADELMFCPSDKTLLANGAKGDPLEDSLWLTTFGVKLPSIVRSVLAWLVENVVGDVIGASVLRASRAKTAGELQQFQAARYVGLGRFSQSREGGSLRGLFILQICLCGRIQERGERAQRRQVKDSGARVLIPCVRTILGLGRSRLGRNHLPDSGCPRAQIGPDMGSQYPRYR